MNQQAAEVLAGLKAFQRDSIEYTFRRLWTDSDRVDKFLVADEVGLGKTMVARGLIAKTVDHLRATHDRIDIVYICSNSQIAQQNLRRLNVVGGQELRNADRLTLLPSVLHQLDDRQVNLVSFTPGTSFNIGSSGGPWEERRLLYWMLAAWWGNAAVDGWGWKRFMAGAADVHRFADRLDEDRSTINDGLVRSFGEAVEQATGPQGGPLRHELSYWVAQFELVTAPPESDRNRRRYALIGKLRELIASSAIKYLRPKLVILDEFQRFKALLDPDNDTAQLAQAVFGYEGAKTLMLSATPYKMYTLPDDPEGDDHYDDFLRTVRFLSGPGGEGRVRDALRAIRSNLQSGGDRTEARAAKQVVETELRQVMSRTERLAATPDRDGMLDERRFNNVRIQPHDVRTWRVLSQASQDIGSYDPFEFWRSTPYPLNLMERGAYQLGERLRAAVGANDPTLRATLSPGEGLLNVKEIDRYRALDPGNAKMRGLVGDVLDRGAWQIAWLPPALPYYELGGAYADPDLQSFTKRLVFSAWGVVPKAIATVLSYEAERRTIEEDGGPDREYSARPLGPPLRYGISDGRPEGMPALALRYPCVTFAKIGDPLEFAREWSASGLPSRDDILDAVEARVQQRLETLPRHGEDDGRVDRRWYWAAPFLLDQHLEPEAYRDAFKQRGVMKGWRSDSGTGHDESSALASHIEHVRSLDISELGRQPKDLPRVLAKMAIADTGTCSLRALSRVCGGATAFEDPKIRDHAVVIARGLRSLFNRPEIVRLVRASEDHAAYWHAVTTHSFEGCLQAVLDEYVHVLLESEGLKNHPPAVRAETIAQRVEQALTLTTASNVAYDFNVINGKISQREFRIRSHMAARFGRVQHEDGAQQRESAVRTAFNSPFRPFVLASTSVGQEGLDFHNYSHAVVHWNLPGNPVDLEQREGGVHRYKGHAVRKNIAGVYADAAWQDHGTDPWHAMFAAAEADREEGESDIKPYWVFAPKGGAVIERYVPALPLSREVHQYNRLKRTIGAYRLVFGQPRQEDLLQYVGDDGALDWLRIDLGPPASQAADSTHSTS